MTHKDWSKRLDLIEDLATVLQGDTLKLALSVVENVGIPRSRLRPDATNLMENHALLDARREGYFEALQNLRSLGVRPSPTPVAEPSPWSHFVE